MLNEVQIKKERTKGTAFMILDLIKDMELTSLMTDIFLQTDDEFAKRLIRRYEYQLIEAFENPKKFQDELHDFYRDTASYIKKNKLYKEFYEFCYFVFSNLSNKNKERKDDSQYKKALNTYYNILLQQMNYFVPHPKLAYGLTTKGQLMLCNEPYPNLDVVLMEAEKSNNMDIQKVQKRYQKMGYAIHSERDFHIYHSNDQLISNMLLVMPYFINEETKIFHPEPYFLIGQGIQLPRPTIDSDMYRTLLKEKRYFLPKQGVLARYENMGEIASIFFMEVFKEDRIVLLYKVTSHEGLSFSGFYDTKIDYLYTPWEATDTRMYHERLENIVLESYAYLTTDVEEKIKAEKLEKRLFNKGEIPVLSIKPVSTVTFYYEEKSEKTSKKKEPERFRVFDKRQYKEAKTTIHPFVRRLPEGAQASEEAIALAKQYNYALRDNETFVRPFERTTYKRK